MKSISNYKKYLVNSCALVLALSCEKGWTMEKDIILACRPPVVSAAQAGERITAQLFDYAQLDQAVKETIIRREGKKEKDGRQRIEETTKFPYSAQVYFVTKFPGAPAGACETGSGTFIHPQVILTAAHVVYSHRYGEGNGVMYNSLQCTPAANKGLAPFGMVRVRGVKIAPQYREGQGNAQRLNDYALVFLWEELGKQTGCLGIAALDDEKLNDHFSPMIVGYPGDKFVEDKIEKPTMWGMRGEVNRVAPEELYYDIDTVAGQSGSGIWFETSFQDSKKQDYYLVGVHAYGEDQDLGGNHGPRLIRDKATKIRQWLEEFEANPASFDFDNKTVIAKQVQERNKALSSVKVTFLHEEEKSLPLEVLSRARNDQEAQAQYEIGLLYANGQGVSQDDKKALEWFLQAANQGDIKAQIKVGMMYNFGHGTPRDEKLAFEWSTKAAQANSPEAQYNLSMMYADGEGIENPELAFSWCLRAAEQGYSEAILRLADLYEQGIGTAKDAYQAFQLFEEALRKKIKTTYCLYRLAQLYEKGEGIGQDEEKARSFYEQAADLGYAQASYELGRLYEEGIGVKKNSKQALAKYEKAAQQGWVPAICKSAELYLEGKIVEKDEDKALAWYQKLLDSGEIFHLSYDATSLKKLFTYLAEKKSELREEKLLLRALENGASEPVIRGLVEAGFISRSRHPDTYQTIFHALALSPQTYSPAVLPLLTAFLAPLEKQNFLNSQDIYLKTPLDYSFEKGKSELLIGLIEQGAYRCQAKKALEFYKKLIDQASPALKEGFKKLMRANAEVEWEIALQEMLPPLSSHEKGKAIQFRTLGKRAFPADLQKQIFKGQGLLNPFGHQGRHTVSSAQKQGKLQQHRLYFKEYPALPGLEEAAGRLTRHFTEFGAPYTELVTIDGRPFLISQEAPGDNLAQVLKHDSQRLQSLDEEELAALIVVAMLINPEDGKPDNYIVSPHPLKPHTYRLISIDNDQAFVPAILREKEQKSFITRKVKAVPQVKTILYCLEPMKKPLPETVRNKIINLRADEVLGIWLSDLEKVHAWQTSLFKDKDRNQLFHQHQSFLGVPFQEGAVRYLYEKLTQMRMLLSQEPSLSMIDLLAKLEPRLAKRYQAALEKPLSVAERFQQTDAQFYEKTKTGFHTTLSRSGDILSSMNILSEKGQPDPDKNPSQALKELKEIKQELESQLLQSLAVRAGDQTFLQNMKLEQTRVTFLKHLAQQGKSLPLPEQEAILAYLAQQQHLRNLPLPYFTALSDRLFQALSLEHLRRLDLRYCDKITNNSLERLSQNAPALEKLNLAFLPQLRVIQKTGVTSSPLVFPALKTLNLANCGNLSQILINAPQLIWLSVEGCTRLTDEGLDKTIEQSPHLKILRLQGTDRIKNRDLFKEFPSVPFNVLSSIPSLKDQVRNTFLQILRTTTPDLQLKEIDRKPEGIKWLLLALDYNTTLTSLDLTGNKVGAEGAKALAQNNTLTSLDLTGNDVEDEGAKALAQNNTLTSLDLTGNDVGDEGAKALAQNNTLTSLDLQSNTVGDEGATALAQNTTLTTLNLYDNKVGAEGAKALAQNTTLTSLGLGNNTVGDEGAKALVQNTTLTTLNLQYNNVGAEGAKALAQNTTLTTLNLWHNNVGDEGAKALAQNTTLTSLDLYDNNVGDEGAKALAQNTTLTTLNLWHNNVGDEGAKALAQNTTLTSLDLTGNDVGDEGMRAIKEMLERNKKNKEK